MGAWNTSLKGNDTFVDIYSAFFDRYNQGEEPIVASHGLLIEFRDTFREEDDKHQALFGLALAYWETKSQLLVMGKSIFGCNRGNKLDRCFYTSK